jgi:hypothetical protein
MAKSDATAKKKSGGKKKKVVVRTTETFDEDINTKEPEEAPPEPQSQEEPAKPKDRLTTPEALSNAAKEMLETLGIEDDWEICVDGYSPQFTKTGYKLKTGEIRRFPGPLTLDEIRNMIRREHGGGMYWIRVVDHLKKIRGRRKFEIDALAKATPEEVRVHEEQYGALVPAHLQKGALPPGYYQPSPESPPQKSEEEEEEDEVARLEHLKEKYEAKIDAELARSRYRRQVKDLQRKEKDEDEDERRRRLEEIKLREKEGEKDEDDDDEMPDYLRGPYRGRLPGFVRPGPGYDTPGYSPKSRKTEQEIKEELRLETENQNLKGQLQQQHERTESLQREMANMNKQITVLLTAKAETPLRPPASPLSGLLTPEVIVALITALTKSMNPSGAILKMMEIQAQAQSKQKPQADPMAGAYEAAMQMILSQTQTSNTMMLTSMQETLKTTGEITRQSIMDAMSAGREVTEEKDWKQTALEKGMDLGKSFLSDIVSLNKEKLGLESKRLDLVGEGKLRPKVPRAIPPGQQPQPAGPPAARPAPKPPQARPGAPMPKAPSSPLGAPLPAQLTQQTQAQAEAAGMTSDEVKVIYARAQALMQAAITEFARGREPEEFARKTLDIAGEDVTMWLMENEGLVTIKRMATEFGYEELFETWIESNPLAIQWIEKWLAAVTESYQFTEAEESPVEEVPAPVEESVTLSPLPQELAPEPVEPTPAEAQTDKMQAQEQPVKEPEEPVEELEKTETKLEKEREKIETPESVVGTSEQQGI